MNRCQVCDKTDEDDPKAGIVVVQEEARCQDCIKTINENTQDLNLNDDDFEVDYTPEYLEQDDHWIEASLPVPDVQEQ